MGPYAFATGALALVLMALWVSQIPPRPTKPSSVAKQTLAEGEKTLKDVEPSASNYQLVASRSLEQLDELLTRQANQAGNQDVIYRRLIQAHERLTLAYQAGLG